MESGNLIIKVKSIGTKVHILTIKNVDTENLCGLMGLFIKETILMIIGRGMEKCIKMELLFIRESGIGEYKWKNQIQDLNFNRK